jgi:hypothetical protein
VFTPRTGVRECPSRSFCGYTVWRVGVVIGLALVNAWMFEAVAADGSAERTGAATALRVGGVAGVRMLGKDGGVFGGLA